MIDLVVQVQEAERRLEEVRACLEEVRERAELAKRLEDLFDQIAQAEREIEEIQNPEKKIGRPEKYSCAQVIEALDAANGVIQGAADRLGCHRHTVENYIKRHPSVKRAWDSQQDRLFDVAYNWLWSGAAKGDWRQVLHVLTHSPAAKRYGFMPRKEITGADGEPLTVSHDVVEIVEYDDEDDDHGEE